MLKSGVAFVRIEKVKDGPAATPGNQRYILQVASYKVRDNASALLNLLKKNGIDASLEVTDAGLNRVVIGGVQEPALSGLKEKLAALGFPNPLIRKMREM